MFTFFAQLRTRRLRAQRAAFLRSLRRMDRDAVLHRDAEDRLFADVGSPRLWSTALLPASSGFTLDFQTGFQSWHEMATFRRHGRLLAVVHSVERVRGSSRRSSVEIPRSLTVGDALALRATFLRMDNAFRVRWRGAGSHILLAPIVQRPILA